MGALSQWIVDEAEKMGFDACGIACATALDKESAHMEQWLEEDHEGEMGYLTRNREKRYDPRLLVEGTKSIVTVLYNYFPKQQLGDGEHFKIAKYAYGADYHDVLKRKMRLLLERIETQTGKLEGTCIFVDSAPVLDRAWAVRCGLGFIGKNTMLIHPSLSMIASRNQEPPTIPTNPLSMIASRNQEPSTTPNTPLSMIASRNQEPSTTPNTPLSMIASRNHEPPTTPNTPLSMIASRNHEPPATPNNPLSMIASSNHQSLSTPHHQFLTAGRSQRQGGGSFFFIGHLFLPLDLTETGQVLTNRCGRCTRCLDACPTGALEAPFHIDARKCISYLTIEYKGSLDGLDRKKFQGWMYGCDICQDVCPYNRFALPNVEPEFQPSEQLMAMREKDWKSLSKDEFEALFKHSAMQRAGFEGLKRNIDFISGDELRDAVHDDE